MDASDNELLETQLKRMVTKLFKDFLVITEDIRQDHLAVIGSCSGQFPPEMVQRWNYLDLPRYSRIRKKVLDAGNDTLREMHTILEQFDVKITKSPKQ